MQVEQNEMLCSRIYAGRYQIGRHEIWHETPRLWRIWWNGKSKDLGFPTLKEALEYVKKWPT